MSGQQQARRHKRPRPPLDSPALRALALHYVGRYATTQGKLKHYLQRKIGERGWVENGSYPQIDSLVAEFAERGYVDDAGFAEAKTHSMLRRGYGTARVKASLRQSGVATELVNEVTQVNPDSARDAALAFARRRRLGPFGAPAVDHKAREKAIAAFIRAGHSYEIAREIVESVAESSDSADFLR